MKKQILVLVMVFLMFPLAAIAMQHGESHGGMSMGGSMIMLQDIEVDGVMASGHMLDTREKMAALGMKETHHFMVGFMNTEGEGLSDGVVALKIQAPDGSVGGPIRLMAMNGAFGSDVTLDQKGMYKFTIGSKLADGKKRSFEMSYHSK
ncbi:hypothetical protein SAMN02745165_00278 [Malonomonas rubra DSM 5091]|uniref:YtkA-like domain-containing protein n=1 Tax=Malonomonas rubra DSM 5091 TaxID=1122189 RepID=A0A1M6BRS9_MALRU|nr:hypothetical protein [Malonomonas rubra]SHI51432.1 hypothetical protein SAMN02745165_00278 [Malonomonas rubra DSM 5091]